MAESNGKDAEAQMTATGGAAATDPPAPAGRFAGAWAAVGHVWDKVSYGLNFEWLSLGKRPSAIVLAVLVLGLAVTVGVTAGLVVKPGTTLGVEFGGGYSLLYSCVQRPEGEPVTDESLQQQAKEMLEICEQKKQPNAVVTALKPNKISVVIPGVTSKEQIAPILAAFEELPLAMEIRSALSMSGTLGTKDLQLTIEAAGIAFMLVWIGLIARYRIAGIFGVFLCLVFLWLQMIFFNASHYALSDAAIVAVVLNIGLSADAHIITFERVREDMHELPYGAPRADHLAAMHRGLRVAFVTVLEANVTTILAMVVLYLVGTGGTQEFAFTVLISVCASLIVNVWLARGMLRLAWNAEWISSPGAKFFGDKGPAYDAEEKVLNAKFNKWVLYPYWVPKRKAVFDFVRFWWIAGLATVIVFIAGGIMLGVKGLNWGVDYTAGTSVAMRIPPPYDFTCKQVTMYAEMRSNATVSRCRVAGEGQVELRFKEAVDPNKLERIVFRITSYLGGPIIYNEYTIDNSLSVEQSRQAIIAMCVAAAATTAFILLRFGPGFALSGFFSMASAGIYAVMCFAMGQYEVNLPIVSAILTVFSYAINDCVVVFDRIRFEMEQPPTANTPLRLRNTVNRAMGLVTIRSLLTLAVVMICSICLVGIGPVGLESFALAITFGLLNATYTTLLLCAPLWYMMRVTVMRILQRSKGGFAPEDVYQGPNGLVWKDIVALWPFGASKGKAEADPAESDSTLDGKSPTSSSGFKVDSQHGSGELPQPAPIL